MALKEVDVAIVGGGPGGMAAALAIQRVAPHLVVRVYERARRLLPMGYYVSLQGNGVSCLKAMGADVYQAFQARYFASQAECDTYFYTVPGPDSPEAGKPPAGVLQPQSPVMAGLRNVRWHEIQKGLSSFLAPGTVVLGYELLGLEETGDGVNLRFREAGEADHKDTLRERVLNAKIVIGADGNQSTVRQAILQDGPPQFLNAIVWRGVAPNATEVNWPHLTGTRTVVIVRESGPSLHRLPTGQQGIAYNFTCLGKPDSPVVWTAFSPWHPDNLDAISRRYYGTEGSAPRPVRGTDKKTRCVETVAGYDNGARLPEFVTKVVSATPTELLGEHALFCRDPEACTTWVKGRVALLGDAAHLGTAFLGQGTNQTLEDAVELARAIARHGLTPEALKEYQEVRLPTMQMVHEGSAHLAKQFWLEGKLGSEVGWLQEHPEIHLKEVEPLPAPCPAGQFDHQPTA